MLAERVASYVHMFNLYWSLRSVVTWCAWAWCACTMWILVSVVDCPTAMVLVMLLSEVMYAIMHLGT